MHAATKRFEIWLKGLPAAAISGGSGGILTGLAAVGIDPTHSNLKAGIGSTLRIGLAAPVINHHRRSRLSAKVPAPISHV